MKSTVNESRSLILTGVESAVLHYLVGLVDKRSGLDPETALEGLQGLVARGVVIEFDGRYQVSGSVVDLLGSYNDPEWAVTWVSSAPAGAALMTVSAAGDKSAVRVAESDDRQAYSWIETSAVLSLVAEASRIEGYRADPTTQLPLPTGNFDEIMASVSELSDSATFELDGREMEEVLSISVQCQRRGVAARSTWVKGADKRLWHLRDLGDDGYCLQGASKDDLWQWLSQAKNAVVHELEPADG